MKETNKRVKGSNKNIREINNKTNEIYEKNKTKVIRKYRKLRK